MPKLHGTEEFHLWPWEKYKVHLLVSYNSISILEQPLEFYNNIRQPEKKKIAQSTPLENLCTPNT